MPSSDQNDILSLSSFAAFSEDVKHGISDGLTPVFSGNLVLSL